jgi:hypothetical protein
MIVAISGHVRHLLVVKMVALVSGMLGPDFDFVLVVRKHNEPSYVMTDVEPERARSLLFDALHHPDAPA